MHNMRLTGEAITVTSTDANPLRVTASDIPCHGVYVRAACDGTGIGSNTGVVYLGPSATNPIHYAVAPSDVAGFPITGIQNVNQLYIKAPGGAGAVVVITPLK